jgi:polysaccharide export outer membrane protein
MSVLHRSIRKSARAVFLGIGLAAFASRPVVRADDYRIGPRDVVEVVVVGESDLTGRYTVRTDGSFEFPLLGTIKVSGLTTADVEARLKQMLAAGYLRNPQVSVKVLDFASQHIFVAGDVAKAGDVPLAGSLTLLEALMKAGGPTASAGPEVVVLRHSGQSAATPGPVMATQPGVQEIARVVLEDLLSGRAKDNLLLQDGDTVYVPRAGLIRVLGRVKKGGALPYERGMTVRDAINAAGGETDEGKGAEIERKVNGQTQRIKAKPQDLIQPGDTITVGKRWW